MAITIGSNIVSLKAQRQLAEGSSALAKTYERLASGLRINHASDDAAGMSIASTLSLQSRLQNQAVQNINDGLSYLAIAEGSLQALSSIVQRQLELAEQASNGSYSLNQRLALDKEASQLTSEFNRIVQSTTFNGIKIFDPSASPLTIQAGPAASDRLTLTIGAQLNRTVGTGSFNTGATYAGVTTGGMTTADLNRDGNMDIIAIAGAGGTTGSVYLGNGDGSFRPQINFTMGRVMNASYGSVAAADFNGDSLLDIVATNTMDGNLSVLLGRGDGSFNPHTTYGITGNAVQAGDFNRDGKLDFISGGSATLSVCLGRGDGTFTTSNYSGYQQFDALDTGDINGDGILDLVTISGWGGAKTYQVAIGVGDGSFSTMQAIGTINDATQIELMDVNHDGRLDMVTTDYGNQLGSTFSVYIGNGNGTFGTGTHYAAGGAPYTMATGDLNNDGVTDLLMTEPVAGVNAISLGNSDGTFTAATAFTTTAWAGYAIALADFNNDGVLDSSYGNHNQNLFEVRLGATTQSGSEQLLNLLDVTSARQSLTELGKVQQRVQNELAAIGAYQSRLSVAARHASTMALEYEGAASRITDADIAAEAANLLRQQTLQDATAAVLAQANQEPSLALRLLSDL